MTQQHRLLPWLPGFLPQAFPTTVSSLTHPGSVSLQSTAVLALGLLHNPQTPAPSLCGFHGTCVSVFSMCGCGKDCLIRIPFRLPQISCFTLSLKCFSSESDSCPDVGIWPLLQFCHPPRAGPVLLTLRFFPLVPSPYWVLHGSIYSFPLVRYSCPFSAGILHVLLCLKVYSWCMRGEMYSTSTYSFAILFSFYNMIFWKCFCFIIREWNHSIQFSSVAQSCLTLCDLMKSLTKFYSCNNNNCYHKKI